MYGPLARAGKVVPRFEEAQVRRPARFARASFGSVGRAEEHCLACRSERRSASGFQPSASTTIVPAQPRRESLASRAAGASMQKTRPTLHVAAFTLAAHLRLCANLRKPPRHRPRSGRRSRSGCQGLPCCQRRQQEDPRRRALRFPTEVSHLTVPANGRYRVGAIAPTFPETLTAAAYFSQVRSETQGHHAQHPHPPRKKSP